VQTAIESSRHAAMIIFRLRIFASIGLALVGSWGDTAEMVAARRQAGVLTKAY